MAFPKQFSNLGVNHVPAKKDVVFPNESEIMLVKRSVRLPTPTPTASCLNNIPRLQQSVDGFGMTSAIRARMVKMNILRCLSEKGIFR